jgi:flagellar assembly factor FliW
MRAPVVLNPVTRRGVQVVLADENYSFVQPLYAAGAGGPSQCW